MWAEPVTLAGRSVRVEALGMEHAEALWRVATPDVFTYQFYAPEDGSREAFGAYVRRILADEARSAFAIVLKETGEAVGTTSFIDIRPAHRGLEIGSTWIARPYQGTYVNPENKYLLLRHSFETLDAVRVQLKTDGRNLQSQAAIAKLGAVREGTLRKHIVLPDGFVRDTVMFSIVADEWPVVKAGLEARLGYVP
jgi:ribosomal-protein-alanine N-acetyltransferase